MNSDLEEPTPTTEEPIADLALPPVPETASDPEEFNRFLTIYKRAAINLKPSDSLSVRICQAFVATAKVGAKFAESVRKSIVDPLNKQVKDANAVWMPIVQGFEAMAKEVDTRVTLYHYEQEQAAIREQKRLQELADREKLRLEQDAAKARQEAEAKRAAGDEMGALKATTKAENLELKAETVAPAIADTLPERTTDLGNGATLSSGKVKLTWKLIGWDKESKLYADNPLLNGVDINWLKRFCVLDPVRLNKAYEGGEKFPHPFTEAPKVTSSRLTQRGGL